ncbi:POTRA domain-containing protein, partial [Acetobacter tropicalis]|uniref:POTRA domain-containing protein n=1 Tax=Acetobacter tropicalis TaxID=104102 RepID=UPI000587A465
MTGKRSALFVSVCLLPFLVQGSSSASAAGRAPAVQADPPAAVTAERQGRFTASTSTPVPSGGVIEDIQVTGNTRIETNTVLSYMVVRPGDSFSQDDLDR